MAVHWGGRGPGHLSRWPKSAVTGPDVTAPTITSASSANNAENSVLAHTLEADEAVTWTIVGGVDAAQFEISGSTLRWVSNGTQHYETPLDSGTNNTYVVDVRATDGSSNTADQTITITVTDVAEGFAWDFEHAFTSGTLPANATFARTGDGTDTNSSGTIATATANNPRYGYNPVTLAARGLLMEKTSTNLIPYSYDFAANWTASTGNQNDADDSATSPDGTTNATLLRIDSAGGSGPCYRAIGQSVSINTAYTFSSFAKQSGSFNWHMLSLSAFTAPASGFSSFDVQNGTVGTAQSGVTSTIEQHAGGWWRCKGSYTSHSSDTSGQMRLYAADADNDNSATRNGNTQSLAWGAQLEESAYATSYIPTAGSTATRGAETLIDTTLSWWNGATGTIYWEGMIYAPSGDHVLWQWDDNTDNERHRLWANGTSIKYTVTDGGSTVAELTLGTYTPGTAFKVAAAFAANDIAAIMSGGAIQTDASATLPTIDRCRYGHGRTGNQLDGWIDNVKFDGTRQDNTALASFVA